MMSHGLVDKSSTYKQSSMVTLPILLIEVLIVVFNFVGDFFVC